MRGCEDPQRRTALFSLHLLRLCAFAWNAFALPVGNQLHPASPSEVRLAEATLQSIRVIADRGYDSDPLRKQLARRGIELIVPHRKNRRKPPTQDGRALRRYKRRWTVERTFAWLGNFRRLVVRYAAC